MRVLIDTNVLADLLLGRDTYYDIAYNILTLCADKKVRLKKREPLFWNFRKLLATVKSFYRLQTQTD